MQRSGMYDYERSWQGEWNDTTRYGPACRHRRRIVIRLTCQVPHARVLDLGCGDGRLLLELSRRTPAELYGADISAAAIEIARKNGPRATFQQMNLAEQTPTGAYDVIIMSEVLEHIEDDVAVLRRLAPLTRHIVISVPGGPADKVDKRYGHFRNYDGDLIVRKLEAAGFDTVCFRRWGWPLYDLQQRLSAGDLADPNPPPVDGRYSPLKKWVAAVFYALYFVNMFPCGTQVFAVGRSRAHPA